MSDSIPSNALIELLAPDGYYKYLEVSKPSLADAASTTADDLKETAALNNNNNNTTTSSAPLSTIPPIDEEAVKKNYRRLSRKHHPDKPGGDADTFRLLNRAQRVLLNPKLRQQYDILGIDLDDDDAHFHRDNDDSADHVGEGKEGHEQSQGIIQEIASMALTSIMQLTVRTVMMGAVAVILVRYRLTLYPALALLAYLGYRIYQSSRITVEDCVTCSVWEVMSPATLAFGLFCMFSGRTEAGDWTWLFWIGEALVIATFTWNSVASSIPKTALTYTALAVFAILSALWFRGKLWNYSIVVGLEIFLALFVALAFPIVEFILEAILNEKLRKVGDRVRMHHEVLSRYYEAQLDKLKKEYAARDAPSTR